MPQIVALKEFTYGGRRMPGERFEASEDDARILVNGIDKKADYVEGELATSTYRTAALKVQDEEPSKRRGRPPLSEEERAERARYRRSDMRAED